MHHLLTLKIYICLILHTELHLKNITVYLQKTKVE
jgi:hypothetical protein